MNNTTTTKKQSKGETFTVGTYNGISILIRDKDGYVNITKLVKEINKREGKNKNLRNFLISEKYNEIVNEWRCVQICTDLEIEVITELVNVDNESKGQYMHKELLHFILDWASIKYSFVVKHIMDSINENNMEKLNNEINELKIKNEGLTQFSKDLKTNNEEKN
jgi:hypothetical protein